ncbi:MAG: thiamine-phosphate kinase [Actinobacteria bacterium]|nr:MAG: thiamine-phosphate kinase [Actinomycetota bacterium]
MQVKDIDEGDLIDRFVHFLPVGPRTIIGTGDDCAVVAAPEGHVIVSTDILVENSHFSRLWSHPYEIGERAAAQNLADIAAMGGKPSSVVLGITVSPEEKLEWLTELARGFGSRVADAGAGVDGGDLSSGSQVMLAVTVLGWCDGTPITRSGAQPGDIIAIAGTLGRSGAGLDLLQSGCIDPSARTPEELGDLYEAVSTYRAPRPPLHAGPKALNSGVHAMMDISDGLALDGKRMAASSTIVIDIDRDSLRADEEALAAASAVTGTPAMKWIVSSGEDHGMLAAFPPHSTLPEDFRIIGYARSVEGGESPGIYIDGNEIHGGWDHFHTTPEEEQ